ncbi:MAG TPA: hemolysin III [Ruminococcaceae bacterium]|nr:hemolysin III [Oscillospiraceae bacterium]
MNTSIQQRNSLYTLSEEIGNCLTHGLAAVISVWGIIMLINLTEGRPWETAAVLIYGISMLILFSMSSLYHGITNVRAKKILRSLDHSSIFILIAGTYTPFTLITLRGTVGWILFGIVWSIAIFGILLNLISVERFKKISMCCYIASGWCILTAIVPLSRSLSVNGLLLLMLGGIFYTSGLLFYRLKTPYMHMTWHFFVLAGALTHFFSVYYHVI